MSEVSIQEVLKQARGLVETMSDEDCRSLLRVLLSDKWPEVYSEEKQRLGALEAQGFVCDQLFAMVG